MLKKKPKEEVPPLHISYAPAPDFQESLRLFREALEEDPALSPEVVDRLVGEFDASKDVDTDGCIQLLYAALEYFVGRFTAQPELRSHIEPLLVRLQALEQREADEFEAEYVARFQVKPGEISDLYAWGKSLLER